MIYYDRRVVSVVVSNTLTHTVSLLDPSITYSTTRKADRVVQAWVTLFCKTLILLFGHTGGLGKGDEHVIHDNRSKSRKDTDVKHKEGDIPWTLFKSTIRALVGNKHKLVNQRQTEKVTSNDGSNDSKRRLYRKRSRSSATTTIR